MSVTENNMNFDVNLLPTTTDDHNLGSSDLKWNLYAHQINGKNYIPAHFYGECSTSANEAAKIVNISDFDLVAGVTIHVKFLYANAVSAPTLNVSSTAAKTIILNNNNLSPWDDGEVISLTYDGVNWRINNYSKIEVIKL